MKLSRIDIIGSNGNDGAHYRHRCHNRAEFPDSTLVQDGWITTDENWGNYTRKPVLHKIPFTMSKMRDGCKQWEPPFGAVIKGIMAESGCDGCKWKPKEKEE